MLHSVVVRDRLANFRSFLNLEHPTLMTFELRGNERAVLRVGGTVLAESRRAAPDTAAVRLAPGSHPISVSHFTRSTPPILELRMRALGLV